MKFHKSKKNNFLEKTQIMNNQQQLRAREKIGAEKKKLIKKMESANKYTVWITMRKSNILLNRLRQEILTQSLGEWMRVTSVFDFKVNHNLVKTASQDVKKITGKINVLRHFCDSNLFEGLDNTRGIKHKSIWEEEPCEPKSLWVLTDSIRSASDTKSANNDKEIIKKYKKYNYIYIYKKHKNPSSPFCNKYRVPNK